MRNAKFLLFTFFYISNLHSYISNLHSLSGVLYLRKSFNLMKNSKKNYNFVDQGP